MAVHCRAHSLRRSSCESRRCCHATVSRQSRGPKQREAHQTRADSRLQRLITATPVRRESKDQSRRYGRTWGGLRPHATTSGSRRTDRKAGPQGRQKAESRNNGRWRIGERESEMRRSRREASRTDAIKDSNRAQEPRVEAGSCDCSAQADACADWPRGSPRQDCRQQTRDWVARHEEQHSTQVYSDDAIEYCMAGLNYRMHLHTRIHRQPSH